MSCVYKIVRDNSNGDIKIFSSVNKKSVPVAILRIDRVLKKKNINSYIMTLGKDVNLLIKSKSILIFARKYANKHKGMIRIDGEQYVNSMRGEILDPIREAISSLTNIYIEKNGTWVINTITNEEVIKLRNKNIDIKYAPMNKLPYKKIYNIYRIFDCGKATITCEKVNEKFSLSTWIIVDKISSMLDQLSIETKDGTLVHGLSIEDVDGSVEAFSPPKLEKVEFEGKYLRLHLTGQSANILNTSYEEIRKAVGKQIFLSGVDTIYELMVDMEIFSVLRDMSRTSVEKNTYKKLIEMSIKNNDGSPILPFWKWVFKWSYETENNVVAIKCRESDTKGIKIEDLVKYINNNKE